MHKRIGRSHCARAKWNSSRALLSAGVKKRERFPMFRYRPNCNFACLQPPLECLHAWSGRANCILGGRLAESASLSTDGEESPRVDFPRKSECLLLLYSMIVRMHKDGRGCGAGRAGVFGAIVPVTRGFTAGYEPVAAPRLGNSTSRAREPFINHTVASYIRGGKGDILL